MKLTKHEIAALHQAEKNGGKGQYDMPVIGKMDREQKPDAVLYRLSRFGLVDITVELTDRGRQQIASMAKSSDKGVKNNG